MSEVAELSDDTKEKLKSAGYDTAEAVLDAGADKLLEIEGMDEETVRHVLEVLNTYFEEANDKDSAEAQPAESEEEQGLQEIHADAGSA